MVDQLKSLTDKYYSKVKGVRDNRRFKIWKTVADSNTPALALNVYTEGNLQGLVVNKELIAKGTNIWRGLVAGSPFRFWTDEAIENLSAVADSLPVAKILKRKSGELRTGEKYAMSAYTGLNVHDSFEHLYKAHRFSAPMSVKDIPADRLRVDFPSTFAAFSYKLKELIPEADLSLVYELPAEPTPSHLSEAIRQVITNQSKFSPTFESRATFYSLITYLQIWHISTILDLIGIKHNHPHLRNFTGEFVLASLIPLKDTNSATLSPDQVIFDLDAFLEAEKFDKYIPVIRLIDWDKGTQVPVSEEISDFYEEQKVFEQFQAADAESQIEILKYLPLSLIIKLDLIEYSKSDDVLEFLGLHLVDMLIIKMQDLISQEKGSNKNINLLINAVLRRLPALRGAQIVQILFQEQYEYWRSGQLRDPYQPGLIDISLIYKHSDLEKDDSIDLKILTLGDYSTEPAAVFNILTAASRQEDIDFRDLVATVALSAHLTGIPIIIQTVTQIFRELLAANQLSSKQRFDIISFSEITGDLVSKDSPIFDQIADIIARLDYNLISYPKEQVNDLAKELSELVSTVGVDKIIADSFLYRRIKDCIGDLQDYSFDTAYEELKWIMFHNAGDKV